MQLHDADEYLVDRADYSWRNYSGLEFSSTEEPHLYQPTVQYSQAVPSQPLQQNQTVWQYSAQDRRLSTRFSLTPR